MKPPSTEDNQRAETENAFGYAGYQVVRGEFFAHIHEPSITFHRCRMSVNTACLNRLPAVEYVQFLVHPVEKKLAVRPCREDEKDSFRWCTCGAKRKPRQITGRIFFAKIVEMMGWNPDYRYRLLGKLIRSGKESLFLFDLAAAEVYPCAAGKNTSAGNRMPSFPAEWKNQFGLPLEEHQKRLQINIFDGYTVFKIEEPAGEG